MFDNDDGLNAETDTRQVQCVAGHCTAQLVRGHLRSCRTQRRQQQFLVRRSYPATRPGIAFVSHITGLTRGIDKQYYSDSLLCTLYGL